jgi:hypothetical protein
MCERNRGKNSRLPRAEIDSCFEDYKSLVRADPGISNGGGGFYGERGARTYIGGLGLCSQWGPGAKPLVGGSGGEAPLKLTRFQQIKRTFSSTFCNKFGLFVLLLHTCSIHAYNIPIPTCRGLQCSVHDVM